MTFDPSANHELDHPPARPPQDPAPAKTSRPPADAREQAAIERLAVVSLDGTLKGWDAGFAASAVAQFDRSQRLTDAQWKHVTRIARCAPLVKKPAAPVVPMSALDIEASEVEAQLDELLSLDIARGGARCLQAVEEMEHRGERLGATLEALAAGDAAKYAAARPVGFGACGSCPLGGATACPRCAAGTPHPGEPCADGRRNRFCRGWSFLASLYARRFDAAGRAEEARECRAAMGLEVKE